MQVHLLRRNHLSSRIQTPMLQGARGHSENMKSNWAHGRQARRWILSHWTCLHRLNESYLRLHTPSSVGFYPYDFHCGAQTIKSSLVVTKTSRPNEMGTLRGEFPIRTQHWYVTWRVLDVPRQYIAMPMTEGTLHPSRSVALTTVYPTGYSRRHASAS